MKVFLGMVLAVLVLGAALAVSLAAGLFNTSA
jgi:hypothetical protein